MYAIISRDKMDRHQEIYIYIYVKRNPFHLQNKPNNEISLFCVSSEKTWYIIIFSLSKMIFYSVPAMKILNVVPAMFIQSKGLYSSSSHKY